MIGRVYTFDASDYDLAKRYGARRYAINSKLNRTTALRIKKTHSIQDDIDGAAYEIAFCRIFNIPYINRDNEDGSIIEYDVILGNGLKLDVKGTDRNSGRLIRPVRKGATDKIPDVYGLITGKFPGPYTFRGFMLSKNLLSSDRIGVLPGRTEPTYIAQQSELKELEDL